MKVLVVSPFPPSRDSNSLVASNMCNIMKREKLDIEITVLGDGYSKKTDRLVSIDQNDTTLFRIWNREMPASEIISSLRSFISSINPEFIIFHFNINTFGNPLKSNAVIEDILRYCNKLNIKTAVVMHSVVANPMRRIFWGKLPKALEKAGNLFLSRFFDRTMKMVVKTSNYTVFPCLSAFAYATLKLPEKLISSISYIPLGLPGEGNQTTVISDTHTQRKKIISYIGYLSPYKGLEDLIKAFALINKDNDLFLEINGSSIVNNRVDTKYSERLKKMIRKMNMEDSVEINGRFLNSSEIGEVLQKSALLVYPFIDDGVYGMSASIYDSLYYPVKIVITDSPRFSGIKEKEFDGVYSAKHSDYHDLAKTIRYAMNDTSYDFSQRIGRLDKYNSSIVARGYIALINS